MTRTPLETSCTPAKIHPPAGDLKVYDFGSSLAAGQIAVCQDTLTVSVVCPDRWFLGDLAVVTSRDGRAVAGQVAGMDVCTGEVAIRLEGS